MKDSVLPSGLLVCFLWGLLLLLTDDIGLWGGVVIVSLCWFLSSSL